MVVSSSVSSVFSGGGGDLGCRLRVNLDYDQAVFLRGLGPGGASRLLRGLLEDRRVLFPGGVVGVGRKGNRLVDGEFLVLFSLRVGCGLKEWMRLSGNMNGLVRLVLGEFLEGFVGGSGFVGGGVWG